MSYLIDGNNLLGCLFPGWHRDPENKLKLVRRLIAFHRSKRARIILLSAEGLSAAAVAERLEIVRLTVYKWRERYRRAESM